MTSDETLINILTNFGSYPGKRFWPNTVIFLSIFLIAIAVNRLILMPYYDVRYSWIIDLPDKCRAIESKIAGLWLAFLILFAMPTILALDRLIDYSLKQQEAIKNVFSSMNVNKSQNGEVIQFRILAKNVLQNYSIWLIFLGTFIDLTNIILKEHNIIDIFKRNF